MIKFVLITAPPKLPTDQFGRNVLSWILKICFLETLTQLKYTAFPVHWQPPCEWYYRPLEPRLTNADQLEASN